MLVQIDLPHDTKQIVQEFQHEMKMKKGLGHYNQQQAIISMVREHGAMKEEVANLKRLVLEKDSEITILKELLTAAGKERTP